MSVDFDLDTCAGASAIVSLYAISSSTTSGAGDMPQAVLADIEIEPDVEVDVDGLSPDTRGLSKATSPHIGGARGVERPSIAISSFGSTFITAILALVFISKSIIEYSRAGVLDGFEVARAWRIIEQFELEFEGG